MEESGWELHKENIQPLSAGRNISLLQQSLDASKTMADHEAEIQQQVAELVKKIAEYSGDDPLDAHLDLLRFLENQCLQNITWKKLLKSSLMDCYQKFYRNPRYQNDARYVETIIKCLAEGVPDPGKRLSLLAAALRDGIGKGVGSIYIAIADHQEALGKQNEALQTLKAGYHNKAQPIDRLESAVTDLEFRIARDLAAKMNSSLKRPGDREFASSVPVYGKKNEAPVFRNDLQPARPVPTDLRRDSQPQKLNNKPTNLFVNNPEIENEPRPSPSSSSASGSAVYFNAVENLLESKSDKENQLDPSKWNKPDTVFLPELVEIEGPRERIAIFTEESTEIKTQTTRTTIQAGVLKDRTPSVYPSENDPVLGDPPQSDRRTAPVVSFGMRADLPSESNDSVSGKIVVPNARLMCIRKLLPNGKYMEFEHVHRIEWLKKKEKEITIEKLEKEKSEILNKLLKSESQILQLQEIEESLRDNLKFELKQKAIKEGQWEQQKYQYNDTIGLLTSEVSEYKERLHQQELETKDANKRLKQLEQENKEMLEDLQYRHSREVEELKARIVQLELAQHASGPSVDSESNSGSSGPRSTSNENECTFINRQMLQNTSRSMSLAAEKLINSTGMSYMGSFMAPPSQLDLSKTNDISIRPEPEQSFNASVKMGGTTTVFGWRGDDKTRFCFDSPNPETSSTNDYEVSRDVNKTGPPPAPMEMLPPPPPPAPKKEKFLLYESMSDSQPLSKSKILPPSGRVLSARVMPKVESKSVAEEHRNNPVSNIVGQTWLDADNAEPPFVPFDPENPHRGLDHSSLNSVTHDTSMGVGPYQPPQLPFDTSNLTCALQCGPAPLLNSTPQGGTGNLRRMIQPGELNGGNFVLTQRIPRFQELVAPNGPMSPESIGRSKLAFRNEEPNHWESQGLYRRLTFQDQEGNDPEQDQNPLNLSPIQETSKESCTTGSSSGNMTSTRGGTMSGVSMFNSNSKSVSAPRYGY